MSLKLMECVKLQNLRDTLSEADVARILETQRELYEKRCKEIVNQIASQSTKDQGATTSSSSLQPNQSAATTSQVTAPPKDAANHFQHPPLSSTFDPNNFTRSPLPPNQYSTITPLPPPPGGAYGHQSNNLPLANNNFERNPNVQNYHQYYLQNMGQPPILNNLNSNNLYPNLHEHSMCGPSTSSDVYYNPTTPAGPPPFDFNLINRNYTGRPTPSAPPRERSVSRSRDRTDEDSKCRTCKNTFGLEIYTCTRGHSSCGACKQSFAHCGICSQLITDKRNTQLESFMAKRKVPCSNKDSGCMLMIKLADMKLHAKECPFSDIVCPLNAIDSGRCSWKGKKENLSLHFDNMHSALLIQEGKELYMTNDCKEKKNVYLLVKGNFYFLFHLWVSEKDRTIYMATQLIGTRISSQKWTYEIQVYNKRETWRKYQYVDVCNPSNEPVSDIFKESRCAALPLSYANNFVNNDVICYKLSVVNTFVGRRVFHAQRGRGGKRA